MAKVLISMREDFLEMIDELAQQEHRSRSELIRQALRDYTTRTKRTETLLDSVFPDDEDAE